ncbi:putative MobA-like protein [Burkholderiales bacterium JOSHI_001]|nr:putative MobA-like protein [Burkholderiales bacterium JOSHI_001]
MNRRPVVIVLAAGRGVRFKGSAHKLAQPFGASTVLGTTLGHVIESHLPFLVVTTDVLAAEAARQVALRDIITLPVPGDSERDTGMGVSIAAGVAARADAAGWLVLPADMPLVQPATIVAVAKALGQYPAVYAQHRGRRGHPVGFAAELYPELAQLTGDDGARRVLARYPSNAVDVDDPGVLMDVDTEADLAALHGASAAQALAARGRGKPV